MGIGASGEVVGTGSSGEAVGFGASREGVGIGASGESVGIGALGGVVGIGSKTRKDCRPHPQDWTDDLSTALERNETCCLTATATSYG